MPIVAIVGRPNVGKSRLFNRYMGERRALVDDRPGITRDRIAAEVEIEGRRILLVDTAGLEPDPDDGLDLAVQAQARVAVEQADAILFVVDGKSGLLPEDQSIARTLRRSDKPLSVAVNKIDLAGHYDRVAEFHALGLEPLRGISAEHGGGCFEVLEQLVAQLPATEPGPKPDPGVIRIAIVGRPNVGKSSLTNRLLGEERVVVSDEPGTTRDRIEIPLEHEGQKYVMIDTAGLRRPGRRHRTAERGSALMTVRSLETADVAILVVDASEGLTDQDAHVAAEICDRGCAAVVVANKWDLVTEARDPDLSKATLEQIGHGLRFLPDSVAVPISAKTGARVRRLLPAVRRAAEAGCRRISTNDLNRWLQQVVKQHEPPAMRRSRGASTAVRFLYATQTGVRPPTFLFFCNQPTEVAASYKRYLENKLREAFDLAGTPIRIRLRAKSKRPRPGGEPGAWAEQRPGRGGKQGGGRGRGRKDGHGPKNRKGRKTQKPRRPA